MKLQIDELGHVTIGVEDWDIKLPFPRLTLTTDYSTWITYISRKDVPANTPITDIKYWKPIGRLTKDILFDYQSFKDSIKDDIAEYAKVITAYNNKILALQKEMESFIQTASSGEAFSNMFGNSEVIGINQRTLTYAFRNLYTILENITGESMITVTTTISPDGFSKRDGGTCSINVVTSFALIDSVKVYLNDSITPIIEETGIESFARTIPLTDTTDVKVVATVLGREYITEKHIIAMSEFFVGAGADYTEVMVPAWNRPYDGDPQGQYNVTVTEGQRIIIVLPTSEASKIEQIEMNDINIPMDISIYGTYTIYTSLNTYQAGNYIIDINY